MKICITLLFALLVSSFSFGQNQLCGTEMPQETLDWLKQIQQNPPPVKDARSGLLYVPIKFHIIGDDTGGQYYKKETLFAVLCELNDQFAASNFYFYKSGNINYIKNSNYYVGIGGSIMINTYNIEGHVNAYITGPIPGLCGYFTGGPKKGAVVLIKGCLGKGNSTFAHELGHYFSLPHTFNGWQSNPEFVNGSNCTTAGDFFCDTPADYLDYRWSCPYTGSKTDTLGDTIKPDHTLFMSYASDVCCTRFSGEQQTVMNINLTTTRNYLLNFSDPAMDPMGTSNLLKPIDGLSNIPVNQIILEWDPVTGAEEYHLVVKKQPNMVIIDVVTSNTKYYTSASGLLVGYTYEWKVKPMNAGNTCEDYSPEWTFIPGFASAIDDAVEDNSLFIYPNPVSSGQDLIVLINSYDFDNDATFQLYDVNGQVVMNQQVHFNQGENNVDLPELYAGVYFVRLYTDDKTYYKRIMILND